MLDDYNIDVKPQKPTIIIEVKDNEQKTPRRTTIKYQTTGIFEDIGKKDDEKSGESIPR